MSSTQDNISKRTDAIVKAQLWQRKIRYIRLSCLLCLPVDMLVVMQSKDREDSFASWFFSGGNVLFFLFLLSIMMVLRWLAHVHSNYDSTEGNELRSEVYAELSLEEKYPTILSHPERMDINVHRDTALAKYEKELKEVDAFYTHIENLFENLGVRNALHNQLPCKVDMEFWRQGNLTIGWELPTGDLAILKAGGGHVGSIGYGRKGFHYEFSVTGKDGTFHIKKTYELHERAVPPLWFANALSTLTNPQMESLLSTGIRGREEKDVKTREHSSRWMDLDFIRENHLNAVSGEIQIFRACYDHTEKLFKNAGIDRFLHNKKPFMVSNSSPEDDRAWRHYHDSGEQRDVYDATIRRLFHCDFLVSWLLDSPRAGALRYAELMVRFGLHVNSEPLDKKVVNYRFALREADSNSSNETMTHEMACQVIDTSAAPPQWFVDLLKTSKFTA